MDGDPRSEETVRTYCVLGNPRGGTSSVAGLLRLLGVYMGDNVSEYTHEDRRIRRKRGEAFERVVQDYNSRFPVWGFKDPTSIDRVQYIQSVLRNPYWIVVLRDPRDVAMSENRNTRAPVTPALKNAQARYNALEAFARDNEGDTLIVIQFDNLLEYPRDTISMLSEWCDIKLSKRQIKQYTEFLERGYKNLNGTRVEGRLESDD